MIQRSNKRASSKEHQTPKNPTSTPTSLFVAFIRLDIPLRDRNTVDTGTSEGILDDETEDQALAETREEIVNEDL